MAIVYFPQSRVVRPFRVERVPLHRLAVRVIDNKRPERTRTLAQRGILAGGNNKGQE
jgi:hypothetical protein